MERIARGSGTGLKDVRALLKEFNTMKEMLKRLQKGRLPAGMKGMKGLKGLKGLKGVRFR
jgi:signal recognition particle subunit SRP54